MASVVTNRLRNNMLDWVFRATALPTNFYIALSETTSTPTVDFNTKAEVTEVANGNGYTTGGISLTKNSTDFDVLTEDDTNDRGLIQLKDIVWTASGGDIPASGNGPRWALLTDDNATQNSREIYVAWDLVSERTVTDTQTLTLQNCEIRLTT